MITKKHTETVMIRFVKTWFKHKILKQQISAHICSRYISSENIWFVRTITPPSLSSQSSHHFLKPFFCSISHNFDKIFEKKASLFGDNSGKETTEIQLTQEVTNALKWLLLSYLVSPISNFVITVVVIKNPTVIVERRRKDGMREKEGMIEGKEMAPQNDDE